jgi:hypothetical protein
MMARPAGVVSAAPAPWTTLAPTSADSPGLNAQASEPAAKTLAPTRNMRRRPKMSPAEPPGSTSDANASR